MKTSERMISRLTAGLVVERLVSSMCEQRSHLPGDVEWTTQSPKEVSVNTDTKQPSQPSECQQCRRSWARRMRGTSGLPSESQDVGVIKNEYVNASSNLPGDESQMGEGVEPTIHESEDDALDGNFNDTRRGLKASNDDYRYDPKHENHPEGPGWRETDRGWSNIKKEKPAQQQTLVQQSKPVQPEPKKPEQPSGVKIHIPDNELTHRVMLKKKDDLKKVLDSGHYSIISGGKNGNSNKEKDMSPTDPMFHERTLQLRDDLEKSGIPYTEVVGVYDSIEPSFMVLHDHEEPFTEKTARNFMVHHKNSSDRKTITTLNRLGAKYNQDSVLHVSAGKNTMVFTTGKQRGKHCGNRGWKEIPEATNYYTDIPVETKEHTKIQVNIQDCFDRGYIKASELLRISREILASDDAPYRWDPKHHHRPLGGKWRRTPAGWSQEPTGAKPGPVPEKKVKHKPGTEGVKQTDTQTQNG